MKAKMFSIITLVLSILFFVFIWGCTDKYQPAPNMYSAEESSCTSCHLDKTLLTEVADPLPEPSEPAGEG